MSHHAEGVRDDGYDDLLDAIDRGEGYSLVCPAGHHSFPPRQVCPHCGSRDLAERALPEEGQIETYTTISVATPQFSADAPYTTAIVDFDGARLTGVVDDAGDVAIGTSVAVRVAATETTGDRYVQFVPR